jgi:hypothetical protein
LLKIDGDEVGGRPLVSLLAEQSRPALKGLLKALCDGRPEAGCEAHLNADGGALHPLRIAAGLAPGGNTVLIVISEPERPQAA